VKIIGYLNVTDGQTDRQTDVTALCVASRGKKLAPFWPLIASLHATMQLLKLFISFWR